MNEVVEMRKFLLAFCLLASGFLFMSLAEAALTRAPMEVPGILALLLLGIGLVGSGVYGRRHFKK